jgi:hypothetical protein
MIVVMMAMMPVSFDFELCIPPWAIAGMHVAPRGTQHIDQTVHIKPILSKTGVRAPECGACD